MGRTLKPSTPFAQRLILARGKKSRAEVALALGCPVETLGNYERGRTFPDLERLRRLRQVLGVSLDWLLTGEGESWGGRVGGGQSPPSVSAEQAPYPVDEEILCWISDEIIALALGIGRSVTTAQVVALAAAWYNDLLFVCHSPEERVIGLRVMLQNLRRSWMSAPVQPTGSLP